jgi:hypothetical protein
VTHGFSTRRGGVSRGEFASLNLGERWGDEPQAVAENLRRLARAGDFAPERLVRVRQVHGNEVLAAGAVGPGVEADAIWHRRADGACVVGVLTADCVPVLLVDEEASVVAAIHSGWRGTVAGVVGRTVEVLAGAGVPARRLYAAIGPCIERAAFEVGEEVAARFDAAFVERRPDRRPRVDLVAAVRAQLQAAGVATARIERVGGCTHADADTYFSYRRDARGGVARTGQHLSFVGWR